MTGASATPWPEGYQDRSGWFRAAATRMAAEGAYPFSTMRLPLGTQRSPASRTGQSARAPETWAAYLTERVLPFWRERGWLDRALVWGWDEPGPVYSRQYAAPQACAAHAAGVAYLTTGAPAQRIPARRVTIPWGQGTRSFTVRAHGADNGFLWDDQGCDDVDIWAVLSRRDYGSFATPVEHRSHIDVQRELRPRSKRRARGERRSGASPTSRRRASDRPGTRPPSRPPTRACSASGTPSRAWTARSMRTAW